MGKIKLLKQVLSNEVPVYYNPKTKYIKKTRAMQMTEQLPETIDYTKEKISPREI